MEITKYQKEHLEEKAHDFAVNTLISRYYPEYEAIKKNRMRILFKLNSENKPNTNRSKK